MHLLAAQPGAIGDGSEAVDLGQTPGDIVVLSAADSELALFAAARAKLPADGFPSLRLASLLHLGHNMSVDLYVDAVIRRARLVVVRLLGGRGYWPYGLEQVAAECRDRGIPVAFLAGDDQPDAELAGFCTVGAEAGHRLWQYCVHGGLDNALDFLRFAATLIGHEEEWREPRPLLRAGLYWPGRVDAGMEAIGAEWTMTAPVAAVVFYRALVQAGNLEVVDALVRGLAVAGLNPLPVFVSSLKDPVAAATLESLFAEAPPAVVLNATGFAVSPPGAGRRATPFDGAGCPVLQVVFAGGNEESWRAGAHGLSARDIAMNVALPEVDGRILAGAVSFKGRALRDPLTETDIVTYRPVADRVAFACQLAANWARLAAAPVAERRVAVVLANYPNRDGRMGNGVGLDVPAATARVLAVLGLAGYDVAGAPAAGAEVIARLAAGPTNDLATLPERAVSESLPVADYAAYFDACPRRCAPR